MPKRKTQPWVGPWRSWYQLERWRKRRRAQLRDEPLCVVCAQRGLVRPASVADHIEHHNGNWSAFLNGKLQSLCKQCHDSDKRYLDKHGQAWPTIGHDGWPIEPG